jgi:hypothetical protein
MVWNLEPGSRQFVRVPQLMAAFVKVYSKMDKISKMELNQAVPQVVRKLTPRPPSDNFELIILLICSVVLVSLNGSNVSLFHKLYTDYLKLYHVVGLKRFLILTAFQRHASPSS